jgi:polysaccharide deacetylase 2 family uncharacterized protein YibQ
VSVEVERKRHGLPDKPPIQIPRSLEGLVPPMTEAQVEALHARVKERVKAYQDSITLANHVPARTWSMEEKLEELDEGFRQQNCQQSNEP